jgi:AraC-like DNA-binding protein
MLYTEHAPAEGLRRFVSCLWTMSHPIAPHRVLPDGCMDLLFSLGFRSGAAPCGRVIGTMTRAIVAAPSPGAAFLGVRFRPGAAAAFLGVGAREARDTAFVFRDVWGAVAREIEEKLAETRDLGQARAVLEQELAGRLTHARAPDRRVNVAVAAIGDTMGAVPVRALAARVGVGERQLERLFEELVGVGPKAFARVVRMQALVKAVDPARPTPWSRVASGLGYADQAHLVREVRALTGLTPGELARERAGTREDVGFVQSGAAVAR